MIEPHTLSAMADVLIDINKALASRSCTLLITADILYLVSDEGDSLTLQVKDGHIGVEDY